MALKSFDQSLRHRLDQSGIRLGVRRLTSCAAYEDLSPSPVLGCTCRSRCRGIAPRCPTVFRITADPSFGALVSFGIGGVATELLDDRAYRAVPLTDADAAELIDAPRAARCSTGTGGPGRAAGAADRSRAAAVGAGRRPARGGGCSCMPVLAGPAGVTVTGATARIGPPAHSRTSGAALL